MRVRSGRGHAPRAAGCCRWLCKCAWMHRAAHALGPAPARLWLQGEPDLPMPRLEMDDFLDNFLSNDKALGEGL